MSDADDIMAWGAHASPEFRQGVREMVQRLLWPAGHRNKVMACMAFESAYSFAPNIRNQAGSGAVGLIQFMPITALSLGTTAERLSLMRPEEQLYYVEKYFKPYAAKITSLSDMYMAILMPKYVGQPETATLFSGGVGYRQNAGLDMNKDGVITKAEATKKVEAALYLGLQPQNVYRTGETA